MYADGTLIGDSNGIYRTDETGEIRIPGLKPGKSVVVTEVRAPAGFILDTVGGGRVNDIPAVRGLDFIDHIGAGSQIPVL